MAFSAGWFAPAFIAAFAMHCSATRTEPAGCGSWDGGQAFCHGPASNFEHNVGYPKADTRPGPDGATDVDCCCACVAAPTCNGWTHNSDGKCYLKTDAGPAYATKSEGSISGLMPPRPPPPPYV